MLTLDILISDSLRQRKAAELSSEPPHSHVERDQLCLTRAGVAGRRELSVLRSEEVTPETVLHGHLLSWWLKTTEMQTHFRMTALCPPFLHREGLCDIQVQSFLGTRPHWCRPSGS